MMRMRGSVRAGVVCGMVGAAAAWGQTTSSTLPAAAPTTLAAPAVASAAAVAVPKANAGQRARVTWTGGALTIAAENSSINQILREVSRVTGMKVTGGVADERVFGTYGPGAPEVVLQTLLTGMGTNMLLKESAEDAPVELVLSPRQGGATPAGPGSFAGRGEEREDDLPPQQIAPSSRGQLDLGRPVFPDPPPAANAGGTPNPVPAGTGSEGSAGVPTPAAVTTDQQSPNGVKTPQQIYDQLMQLQKQKAAQTPPQ